MVINKIKSEHDFMALLLNFSNKISGKLIECIMHNIFIYYVFILYIKYIIQYSNRVGPSNLAPFFTPLKAPLAQTIEVAVNVRAVRSRKNKAALS